VDLTYLLCSLPPAVVLGEDFNCILTNADCTGNINYSKALEKIVRGLNLVDVWGTVPPRAIYTHHTPHGAAHLDRIYVSANLSGVKVGAETVFAVFTNHLAVCLRLCLEIPLLQRGRGLWKMNKLLFDETTIRSCFQLE
jgi:hypothetical protein